MKAMKKIMVMLLCAAMLLAFAACGNESTTEPQQTAAQPSEQPGDTAVTDTPELSEEEAWKLEPAYGQTLHYLINGGCSSGPFMADYLGYYEDAGLKVEGLKANGTIVEAVGTNTIQIAIEHIATSLVPSTNNVDITFVGGAHIGCKSLYVLGDSEYQTTADLKGLKVSIPDGVGNSDYNIAARFFDADGIDPMKDVDLVQVEAGACVAAMQRGEIAAANLSDMFAYDMVQDGTLRRVRSLLDDDFAQEPCCVIIMNSNFIEENPITAKKLASCVKKAHEWMFNNLEETTDILINEGLCSGDHEKVFNFLSTLDFGPADDFSEKALEKIVDDYVRLGLVTTTDSSEAIMDKVWTPIGSADEIISAEESEEEAWKLEPAYGQTLYYWVADSCVSAPIVADELGYYEEAGLTVEGFKGDSDVEALGTASAHVAVGHIAKQLVPATNGVDLVFVGGAHKGCKSLYVLGDSQFESTADLKGQKIAVPNGIGNSDYNITARLLDADGIDPLKDVSLVQVDNGACVAAMQNGELGAALLGDTYAYDMLKNGTLRKVRSMLDEDLDQICCVIGMNGTFVKENPITAKKLASCVRKALKWMNENPEEATQMLLDLGLSSGEFEKNLEINKSLQFGPDDDYAQAELRDLIDDYLRIGLITSDMDADEIMDMVWMPTGSAD